MDTSRLLFVSHSHQDDPFCLRLIADLRANLGENAVWYDTSGGLHGGDNWWNRIIAEITERPYFLVVLSPHASESKWVPEEMAIAYRQKVELGKRLLPVRLADSPRREDWKGVQEFDFTQPDNPARYAASLAELLHAIIPTLIEPVMSAPSATPAPVAPERQLSPTERLAQETHTAYGLEHWSDVLDKTQILIERNAMTPVLWRERASAAYEIGDAERGLVAVGEALRMSPDDPDILLLSARLLIKNNNDWQAIDPLTRAYTLVPLDDTATRLLILDDLTVVLGRLHRRDEFTRRIGDARRLAPNDPHWIVRLIQMLQADGQFDEVVAAVRSIPSGMDVTPFLPTWKAAVAATTQVGNWQARRTLLEVALTAGVAPEEVSRWRHDFPGFVLLTTIPGAMFRMPWSPDGRLLAIIRDDFSVHVWEVATGRPKAVLKTSQSTVDVAWSPDGRLLRTPNKTGDRLEVWVNSLSAMSSGRWSRRCCPPSRRNPKAAVHASVIAQP